MSGEKDKAQEKLGTKKSPGGGTPSPFRPTLDTISAEQTILPQDLKWPNDSPHHV